MTERPKSTATMSLGEHLEELRRRLIIALVGILPILIVALLIGKPMLAFLLEPLTRALADADLSPQLQAVSATETFNNYLKIAIVLTVMVGAPWIIGQLWLFVAPGLYANERRFAYVLAPLSFMLTALSMLFLYYVILPIILAFFIAFGASLAMPEVMTAPWPADVPQMIAPLLVEDPETPTSGLLWYNTGLKQLRIAIPEGDGVRVLGVPMVADALVAQQYRVHEHVKLVLNLAVAFGLSFQMPVVVLLLGWAGIINPTVLAKYRRHALLILCAVGAVLTPADPLSMLLLAVPLYLLYEFGLLLVRFLPASRVSGRDREASEETEETKPSDEDAS